MKKSIIILISIFIASQCNFLSASEITEYHTSEKLQPKTVIVHDGTLIMSNSPEIVKEVGILYSDQFKGKGRLLFHHVNATDRADKKLVITVENLTNIPQTFIIQQYGLSSPDYNYLKVGEEILDNYFDSATSDVFFLNPYETNIIYDSSLIGWPVQTVLSGMLDIEATGAVRVTFAMLNEGDEIEIISQLPYLKKDAAPRGTFECLTIYQCLLLNKGGKSHYLIEDDSSDWVKGWDALDHQITINHGNYGIMYKITLIALSDTNILICPRGGIFQGKVYWEDGELITIKRPHVFKKTKEPIKIGELKMGEVRTLIYFLPNGSAAPILISFENS